MKDGMTIDPADKILIIIPLWGHKPSYCSPLACDSMLPELFMTQTHNTTSQTGVICHLAFCQHLHSRQP